MPDRKLDYDPTCVAFLGSGEYFVVTGSSAKIQLYTREGIFLGDIVSPTPAAQGVGENAGSSESLDAANWSWALAVKPKSASTFSQANSGFNIIQVYCWRQGS